MSFQKNGDRTLGRYVLVPNPDTERLFREAVRLYGDVLKDGERVGVATYTKRVAASIPADDGLRADYVRALSCAMEIAAEQDIGTGQWTFAAFHEYERATGVEVRTSPSPAHQGQA